MKILGIIIALSTLIFFNVSVQAKEEATAQHSHEKDHDEHDDSDVHDDHHEEDKHEHESGEANASVGPNKGITEYSEDEGFKLSAEAIKNFELQQVRLNKIAPWVIPTSAVLHSGEEINVYRLRNGFYKRIDFTIESKAAVSLTIRSKDLKEGDEVVTQGVGFLRTAEIVATGGAPEGHSH